MLIRLRTKACREASRERYGLIAACTRYRIWSLALAMIAAASAWGQQTTAAPLPQGAVVLDHVVAVINGSVILESDVQEEMRYGVLQPFSVNLARNTPQRALQRLIDRALIEQQMQMTQFAKPPTPEEVEERLKELRAVIPACAQYHCDTEAGWQAFLKAHGLTEKEVEKHWTERMTDPVVYPVALRLRGSHYAPGDCGLLQQDPGAPAPRAEAALPGMRSPAASRRSCCNNE